MPHDPQPGLLAHLRRAATGPTGVRSVDVQGWTVQRVSAALWHLAHLGQLHRANLGHKRMHFFDCQARAAAFEADNRHKYVAPQMVKPMIEQSHDLCAKPGSARSQRQEVQRARASGTQATERGPVRITYGPCPTVGPMAGSCPPDRPLIMRPGALDYQRHMAKHRSQEAGQ